MAADSHLSGVFSSHPRRWRTYRYVYPVISRRAHGLSIGINLNPDAACNFDCIYCCTNRREPRHNPPLDLKVLEAELRQLVEMRDALFDEPEFRDLPPDYRRLNDIAFSGNGEPTASPVFAEAVRIAVDVRRAFQLDEAKLVLITNGCFLTRRTIAPALALLDENNGEIWAKLDAGTEAYFQRVNRATCTLQHVLNSILERARTRPLVLQSLFVRIDGEPPADEEVAAYAERVRWLVTRGGALKLVQVYTVARRTAEDNVEPLQPAALERIADTIRPLGVPVEVFG
jgi:wyosine [tRNA(Phe)-imidazoG37] synthetase (radical SAM superfamily)